jgi:hypothetical protein
MCVYFTLLFFYGYVLGDYGKGLYNTTYIAEYIDTIGVNNTNPFDFFTEMNGMYILHYPGELYEYRDYEYPDQEFTDEYPVIPVNTISLNSTLVDELKSLAIYLTKPVQEKIWLLQQTEIADIHPFLLPQPAWHKVGMSCLITHGEEDSVRCFPTSHSTIIP